MSILRANNVLIQEKLQAKSLVESFESKAAQLNDSLSFERLDDLHSAETELCIDSAARRSAIIRTQPGTREAALAGDPDQLACYLEELIHACSEPLEPAAFTELELIIVRAIDELETEFKAKELAGLVVTSRDRNLVNELKLAYANNDTEQAVRVLDICLDQGLISRLDLQNFYAHNQARYRAPAEPLTILSANSKQRKKEQKAKERTKLNKKKQQLARLESRSRIKKTRAQRRKDLDSSITKLVAIVEEEKKRDATQEDSNKAFGVIMRRVEARKAELPEYFPPAERSLSFASLAESDSFELLDQALRPSGFEITNDSHDFRMVSPSYGRALSNGTSLNMQVDGDTVSIPVYLPFVYRNDANEQDLAAIGKLIHCFNQGLVASVGVSMGGGGYGLLHSHERHGIVDFDKINNFMKKDRRVHNPVTVFPRNLPDHELLGVLRYSLDPRNIVSILLDARANKFALISRAMPGMILGTKFIKTVFSLDGGLVTAMPTNTGEYLKVILAKCSIPDVRILKDGRGRLISVEPGTVVPEDTDRAGYRPIIVCKDNKFFSVYDFNSLYQRLLNSSD